MGGIGACCADDEEDIAKATVAKRYIFMTISLVGRIFGCHCKLSASFIGRFAIHRPKLS
jgi:hypothetical protein